MGTRGVARRRERTRGGITDAWGVRACVSWYGLQDGSRDRSLGLIRDEASGEEAEMIARVGVTGLGLLTITLVVVLIWRRCVACKLHFGAYRSVLS